MKPLVSQDCELRLFALGDLGLGLVLTAFALSIDPAGSTLVDAGLTALAVGGGMWFFGFRRHTRDFMEMAQSPPNGKRESHFRTSRRALLTTLVALPLLLALAVLADTPGLVGGMAFGMFALRLTMLRSLRRWELDHELHVLREPRWRWSRYPEDVYVEPLSS